VYTYCMDKKDRTGTVYVIKHPETLEIVYVGQTVMELWQRLANHLSVARCAARSARGNNKMKDWLLRNNRPIIEPIVTKVPYGMLRRLEWVAIRAMLATGVKLLNDRVNYHCA